MFWEQQQKWTGQEQALGLLQWMKNIVFKMAASALCVKFENKAWRAGFKKTNKTLSKTDQTNLHGPCRNIISLLLLSTYRNHNQLPTNHILNLNLRKSPQGPLSLLLTLLNQPTNSPKPLMSSIPNNLK